MVAFLAAMHILDGAGLRPSLLRAARPAADLGLFALLAATGGALAIAPLSWRRALLVIPTPAAHVWVLGAWGLVPIGYAALVMLLARARFRLRIRVALAMAAWAALPLARIAAFPVAWQAATIFLAFLWAGAAYAALFVLVERERALPGERAAWSSEAFYLLALPRLAAPFFQPISSAHLAARERPGMPPRLVLRAAGLGLYGLALGVLAELLPRHLGGVPPPGRALLQFAVFYAWVTHHLFVAVALFRLLGFGLDSGFRAPFLSRSFGEFFRRYNHYVRDAVLSLFYYPILGRLRTRLSARAATILAAYAAILVGSFLLNDFLVPVATSVDLAGSLKNALALPHLAVLTIYWTLVILPSAGLPRATPRPATRIRKLAEIAAFNALFFAIWYFFGWNHGAW